MSLFTPRLLITDDDRDFRETVAGVLADRGFETLQAGDGEEALKIVCRHEVHLILLDMQMPRLNGLDTIERIRGVGWALPATSTGENVDALAQPSLRFPPWILISGALDDQIVARAKAAAVFSVLPKPLRLPDLTGAVANALEQAYGWRAA
ncbi:MAG TPA: response regulator [Pirellulaceae bacterium]|jgi:CheY-like chemotaxis protein